MNFQYLLPVLILVVISSVTSQQEAVSENFTEQMHGNWYFWTQLCKTELEEANNRYANCFKNAIHGHPWSQCKVTAKNIATCLDLFEKFTCSKLDVQEEIRKVAKRERLVVEKIFCELGYTNFSNCLGKISNEVSVDCKMAPDMTLIELCVMSVPVNECITNIIDNKCVESKREITKSYFRLLTESVICASSVHIGCVRLTLIAFGLLIFIK